MGTELREKQSLAFYYVFICDFYGLLPSLSPFLHINFYVKIMKKVLRYLTFLKEQFNHKCKPVITSYLHADIKVS